MIKLIRSSGLSQKGVALITVLMVMAIATAIAAHLIRVVNARIEIHDMHYQRLQSRLVLQTGTEWAASILSQEKKQSGELIHLGQIWAQPLPTIPVRIRPEDPLSTIAISGSINDAQSRLNLNNLVLGDPAQRALALQAYQKLLAMLGYDKRFAYLLLDWMDDDDELSDVNGAETDYYLSLPKPYRASNQPQAELGNLIKVRDYTPEMLADLSPYVTFLPRPTPINVNTASAEVLSSVIAPLSLFEAQTLIEARKNQPFRTFEDFLTHCPEALRPNISTNMLSLGSDFFEVKSSALQQDRQTQSLALVERRAGGWPVVWWQVID